MANSVILSPEDMERIRRQERQRKAAVLYLEELMRMGLPYMWGGDDPIGGFDCSGQIVEILQSVGKMKHGQDATAHDLYLKYKPQTVEAGNAGCLVFWLKNGRATHIEMMANNWQTIGASGGGRPQFNLWNETRKCDFLMSIYGKYTRDELKDLENTFLLKFVKTELYRQQAADQNAYIKRRPLGYRGENYKICDPFKE
jgi:cell wall-associated NlpC family hydrolase